MGLCTKKNGRELFKAGLSLCKSPIWKKTIVQSLTQRRYYRSEVFFPARNAKQVTYLFQCALNTLCLFALVAAFDGQMLGHGRSAPAGKITV